MVEINYLKSIINDILKQYKYLIRLSLDNEEHDFTNLTSRVKMLYLKAQNIMIFFSKQQLDTLYFNAKGNILNPNLSDLDKKTTYFIINYYERKFNLNCNNKDQSDSLIYTYKKMYDVLVLDSLYLRNVDSDFYDEVKGNFYKLLYNDLLTTFDLEFNLIKVNFDLSKLNDAKLPIKDSYWYIKSLISKYEIDDVKDASLESLIVLLKRKMIFNYYLEGLDTHNIENLINYLNYKNDGSNKTLYIYDTMLKEKGR